MAKGFEWWPVEKITTDPPGPYVQVLRNHWWIFNERNEILMYRVDDAVYPQCNTSRSFTDRIIRAELHIDGALSMESRQLRIAFTPIIIEDYR